ncbi:MAG: hypothetical protein AAFO77_15065, partial [Pseudomonadota bacterium]
AAFTTKPGNRYNAGYTRDLSQTRPTPRQLPGLLGIEVKNDALALLHPAGMAKLDRRAQACFCHVPIHTPPLPGFVVKAAVLPACAIKHFGQYKHGGSFEKNTGTGSGGN